MCYEKAIRKCCARTPWHVTASIDWALTARILPAPPHGCKVWWNTQYASWHAPLDGLCSAHVPIGDERSTLHVHCIGNNQMMGGEGLRIKGFDLHCEVCLVAAILLPCTLQGWGVLVIVPVVLNSMKEAWCWLDTLFPVGAQLTCSFVTAEPNGAYGATDEDFLVPLRACSL